MHDIQDSHERAAVEVVAAVQASGGSTNGRTPEHAMKFSEARQNGIDAHQQVFSDCDPSCSEKCLSAQINAYHRQKSVGVRDGTPVRTKPVGADNTDPAAVQHYMDMLND
jgi:hypothetical protein